MSRELDFARLSFLVIDDNSHMRRLVRSLLHGFGSRQVHEAEDGATGLEALETHNPSVLIIDYIMPILDGVELAQLIRNPDGCRNAFVPIIMMTGHAERRRVMEARDAGVTEILAKPISTRALHDRIYNIVVNPRPFIKTGTYFGPDRRRVNNPNYAGTERRRQDQSGLLTPVQPAKGQFGVNDVVDLDAVGMH